MDVDGVLVLDKPAGMTSHDVVARVRRLTGERKVGHTGTLDPLATGVLVLCLGRATKVLPYLPEGTKTYQVQARLGASTDTQDRTGRIIEEKRAFQITHAELDAALRSFVGSGTQIPPMYSAVRVGGKRLHQLARAGIVVERPAREIRIESITLDDPSADGHPLFGPGDLFTFTVTGSRGMYVRTLCHDLGQRLGCGAHLTKLRRLASGPFCLDAAIPLEGLTGEAARQRLIPLDEALAHLPAVHLDAAQAVKVLHGNCIPAGAAGSDLARAVDPGGRTIAVLARRGERWQPERVF